jgi:hypothetical protein
MTNRRMIARRGAALTAGCVAAALAISVRPQAAALQNRKPRPDIELRDTPPVGVAPLRIVATAELKGGDDDYSDFYCPKIQWEWSDGTTSESADDCDPYEKGKSEIRRRYSVQHTYKDAGAYRIIFHLQQGTKNVGSATIKLEVHGY